MKVFLSHSSVDKWLARRIAKEISELGAQTFLDEKDIATGESIDEAIQANLADCQDLLILLSPASIKSEWVLVELGGALALKKNVIPILLYVGANDMPKPISKLKGRDIADIDKYYQEIKTRVPATKSESTVVSPKRHQKKRVQKEFVPQIGQRVVLPKSPPEAAYRDSGQISFNDEMAKYCGLTAIVQKIEGREFLRVDVDGGRWGWAYEWLVPAREG